LPSFPLLLFFWTPGNEAKHSKSSFWFFVLFHILILLSRFTTVNNTRLMRCFLLMVSAFVSCES
jgi:hypothetical protein